MGYQTSYEIKRVDGDIDAFKKAFKALDSWNDDLPRWFGVGVQSEMQKWYHHEKHIAVAMLRSGCKLVLLRGEGSEAGDIWEKEFVFDPNGGGQVLLREFRFELRRPDEPKIAWLSKDGERVDAPPCDAEVGRG